MGALLAIYSETESIFQPACKYPTVKWIRIFSPDQNTPEAVAAPPEVEEVSKEEAEETIFTFSLREQKLPVYRNEKLSLIHI